MGDYHAAVQNWKGGAFLATEKENVMKTNEQLVTCKFQFVFKKRANGELVASKLTRLKTADIEEKIVLERRRIFVC